MQDQYYQILVRSQSIDYFKCNPRLNMYFRQCFGSPIPKFDLKQLHALLRVCPNLKRITIELFYTVMSPMRNQLGDGLPRKIGREFSDLKNVSFRIDSPVVWYAMDTLRSSGYSGVLDIVFRSCLRDYLFDILSRPKCPVALTLSGSSFTVLSREDVRQIQTLSPILKEILIDFQNFEDPQHFIQVLNSFERLDTLMINQKFCNLNLGLLRSKVTTLILSGVQLSHPTLQTMLQCNPLVQRIRLTKCYVLEVGAIQQIRGYEWGISGLQSPWLKSLFSEIFSALKFQNLLELDLHASQWFENRVMISISTLKQLQKLTLYHNYSNNSGLIYLKRLRRLRYFKEYLSIISTLPLFLQVLKSTGNIVSVSDSERVNGLEDAKPSRKRNRESIKAGLRVKLLRDRR